MARTPALRPIEMTDDTVEVKKGRKPDFQLRIRQPSKLNRETGKRELNESYITVASLWSTEWADKQTGEMMQGWGVRFHLRTIELGEDAGGIIVPYRERDQS